MKIQGEECALMYCVRCGCKLEDNANFCYNCGSPVAVKTDVVPQELIYQPVEEQAYQLAQRYQQNQAVEETQELQTDVLSPMEHNVLYSSNSHLMAVGTLDSSKGDVVGQKYNGVIEDYKKIAQADAMIKEALGENKKEEPGANSTPAPQHNATQTKSSRSKVAAALLCIFLGELGIHRFYAGRVGTGLLWMFTLGLCGIGTIVDFIVILCGGFKDGDGKKI